MKQWMVRLKGERFDLEELPYWLTQPPIQVIEEDGGFYLTSTEFDALTEAGTVHTAARAILQLVNTTTSYVTGSFQPVEDDGVVVGIDQDGTRRRFLFAEVNAIGRSKARCSLAVGKENGGSQPTQVDSLVALARWDANVAEALRLFLNPNGVNLFKIWEIVKADVGGETKIIKDGWTKKQSISNFTGSVNNQKVLGGEARHSRLPHKPPRHPMTLREARAFIKTLLDKWLRTKLASTT